MGFTKVAAFAFGLMGLSQAYNLNVASSGSNSSSPLAYGVMFEDINHSGDGGIYAELIQNRAFQLPDPSTPEVAPWTAVGGAALAIDTTLPLSALPNSVKVTPSVKHGWVGLANPGWWGIDVQPQTYSGEFYIEGTYNGPIKAALVSSTTGQTFASTKIQVTSKTGNWTHVTYTLTSKKAAEDINNVLQLTFQSAQATDGSLHFNFISLFPPTYKNRANGMRIDLMEALAELSPSFNRIPGGNNIEGDLATDNFFNWSLTIGPQIDRPGRQGTWGYFNTEGLGLAEYLNWCVDLDMEPLLAVYDGHNLNGTVISEADLQPYIDDVLNELEYIMGDPTTTYWGAIRAQHGFPEGWNINYVEIGNEDYLSGGQPSYSAYRYQMFESAIKAQYPHIVTVSSDPSIIDAGQAGDYHIYSTPDEFVLTEFSHFDNVPSDTYYFAGEYATVQYNKPPFGSSTNWSAPLNSHPFWEGSIGESVFLIGTERNGDKVIGASYAPTLANNNSIQWGTDMIYFTADTSGTVRSTSHHTIKLLSGTRFTETLPVTSDTGFGPLYYVAGQNTDTGSSIAKMATYNATDDVPVALTFEGVAPGTKANLTWISAPGPFSYAYEGYDPVTTTTEIITSNSAGAFEFFLPNYVVAVLATEGTYGGYGVGANTNYAGFGGYSGCKGGKSIQSQVTSTGKLSGNGC